MAIEITGKASNPIPIKTSPKSGANGEQKVAATVTEKNDTVALTSTTQEIKKAIGLSSALPVDIDKVNAVKKTIADGSYTVNAEKVAKKLIEFEKLMPQENNST